MTIDELIERMIDERLALRTVPQLVDLAKIGIAKRTMYRAVRAGEIEGAIKIERRWYAPPAAIEKWVEGHRPPPPSPMPESEQDRKDWAAAQVRADFGLRLVKGANGDGGDRDWGPERNAELRRISEAAERERARKGAMKERWDSRYKPCARCGKTQHHNVSGLPRPHKCKR